jgi:hypothetical protein
MHCTALTPVFETQSTQKETCGCEQPQVKDNDGGNVVAAIIPLL